MMMMVMLFLRQETSCWVKLETSKSNNILKEYRLSIWSSPGQLDRVCSGPGQLDRVSWTESVLDRSVPSRVCWTGSAGLGPFRSGLSAGLQLFTATVKNHTFIFCTLSRITDLNVDFYVEMCCFHVQESQMCSCSSFPVVSPYWSC